MGVLLIWIFATIIILWYILATFFGFSVGRWVTKQMKNWGRK